MSGAELLREVATTKLSAPLSITGREIWPTCSRAYARFASSGTFPCPCLIPSISALIVGGLLHQLPVAIHVARFAQHNRLSCANVDYALLAARFEMYDRYVLIRY